jgi:hypothetical protein
MRSSSPHSCYTPRPSHHSRLDYSNYTWRRVQIRKLLFIILSSSCLSENNIYIYIYIYILADYPALPGYLFNPIFYRTNTYTSIFIYRLYIIYKIIFLYMYVVIRVPSLVEIAPGVPELCWNIQTYIHTHTHPFIYFFNSFISNPNYLDSIR